MKNVMSSSPRFSIIVPVYNTEKYIEQCICSVVCQSFLEWELILIDDGSNDNCLEICVQWAKRDSRIVVYHQENKGQAAARNYGVQHASGDYILFLDSDDFWCSDSVLGKIAQRLNGHDTEVLNTNFIKLYLSRSKQYFSDNLYLPEDLSPEEKAKYVFDNNLWISSPCNKVIRKELFNDNQLIFAAKPIAEDIEWSLQLAIKAEKVDYYNVNLFYYRQRSNSTSSDISLCKELVLADIINNCVDIVKCHDARKKEYLESYAAYQYAVAIFRAAQINDESQRSILLKKLDQHSKLLKRSTHIKVRMVNAAVTLLGINNTVKLLRAKRLIKALFKGEKHE